MDQVKSWRDIRPGMEMAVKLLKQKDLPSWCFADGVNPKVAAAAAKEAAAAAAAVAAAAAAELQAAEIAAAELQAAEIAAAEAALTAAAAAAATEEAGTDCQSSVLLQQTDPDLEMTDPVHLNTITAHHLATPLHDQTLPSDSSLLLKREAVKLEGGVACKGEEEDQQSDPHTHKRPKLESTKVESPKTESTTSPSHATATPATAGSRHASPRLVRSPSVKRERSSDRLTSPVPGTSRESAEHQHGVRKLEKEASPHSMAPADSGKTSTATTVRVTAASPQRRSSRGTVSAAAAATVATAVTGSAAMKRGGSAAEPGSDTEGPTFDSDASQAVVSCWDNVLAHAMLIIICRHTVQQQSV